MAFNRLNVIYMYNFGMGSADVADQLCIKYIPDHWMCSMEWWWYIFIWGFGGDATDEYLIYRETIYQTK